MYVLSKVDNFRFYFGFSRTANAVPAPATCAPDPSHTEKVLGFCTKSHDFVPESAGKHFRFCGSCRGLSKIQLQLQTQCSRQKMFFVSNSYISHHVKVHWCPWGSRCVPNDIQNFHKRTVTGRPTIARDHLMSSGLMSSFLSFYSHEIKMTLTSIITALPRTTKLTAVERFCMCYFTKVL